MGFSDILGIVGTIGTPDDPIANEQKILNAGRVPYKAFEVSVAVLFSVAAVAVIARVVHRLYTRRRIYLDDAFLIFAFACLTAATVVVYRLARLIYTNEALKVDPTVVVPLNDVLSLANSLAFIHTFLSLAWTAIFFVKFSFLALFRVLLKHISRKLSIYFWVMVGYFVVTWMFLVTEAFIVCPYYGAESIKCTPETPRTKTLALTIFITILDVTSDIMIVSIPVLMLRQTQMRLSQKLSLSVFLCLSIVMALAALTRISGYRIRGKLDITWEIFWMWTEACIAVIMGSIVVLRALLIQGTVRRSNEKPRGPSYSMRERILKRIKRSKDSSWEEMGGEGLPQIPSATMTGVRTFIRRNNRTFGASTVMHSELDQIHEGRGEGQHVKSISEGQIYVDDQVEVQSKGASSHNGGNEAVGVREYF